MMERYILDGHQPVPCPDLLTWGRWMGGDERRVARDVVGDVVVSTVFLGLDHRFAGEGAPILFETMVFGGPLDGDQDRCATWDKALAQHAAMLARVHTATEIEA